MLKSEFMWLWLPTIIILIINAIVHRTNKKFNELKNGNEISLKVGKSSLDITEEILKIVDKEISKIKF